MTFGGSTFRWCYFSDAEEVVKQAETVEEPPAPELAPKRKRK